MAALHFDFPQRRRLVLRHGAVQLLQHGLGLSKNHIERRAELMAHIRQEAALGGVRRFGALLLAPKFDRVFGRRGLGFLALGDVPTEAEEVGDLTLGIADRGNVPREESWLARARSNRFFEGEQFARFQDRAQSALPEFADGRR